MSAPVHPPRWPSRWPRRWLLWLAAGLVLRMVFIYFPRPVDDDTNDYLEFGHNLLHHGIYGMTDGTTASPTLYRLPGYPIFLAVFEQLFAHIWPNAWFNAVFLAQTAADLAACLLLAAFARRHLGPRAAEVALALAVLCPFTAVYVGIALTESLSVFAVSLGIYAAGRALAAETAGAREPWALTLAGCGAALAMLLRPDGFVFFVALAGSLFWYILRRPAKTSAAQPAFRRALAATSLFCFVALLPLVPWTLRNWAQFHVFQPLAPRYADPGEFSIAGARSWLRTWTVEYVSTANVCWNFPGGPIDPADLPLRAFDSPQQREQTLALIAEYNRDDSLSPSLNDRFAALADQRIRDHPFRYYVTLPLLRVADMLLRPRTIEYGLDVFWWRWSEHPAQSAWAILLGLINLFYVAAAAWAFLRRRVPWALMLGSYIILRCLVLGAMENPEPRYTVVFFPIFIIAAAALTRAGAVPGAHPGTNLADSLPC